MNAWQHVPNIRYCNFYVNDLTTDTIPAITSSISAIYTSPETNNPIKNNGKIMIVSKTFKIPQDALKANRINFPNTANIKIINNAVNIVFSPYHADFSYSD